MKALFLKFPFLFLITVSFACSVPRNLPYLLEQYVAAANSHDLERLQKLMDAEIIWRIGNDTLTGINAALRPLSFDKGAKTVVSVSEITEATDTLRFMLTETNEVLTALGIPQLRYAVQFTYRGDQIVQKEATLDQQLQTEFFTRIMDFASWLKEKDSEAFKQIWSENWKFNYAEETARLMIQHIERWNSAQGKSKIGIDSLHFLSNGFHLNGYFFYGNVPYGPTLLFAQGFMDTGDIWDIGKALSAKGINVFEFDFRGCYGSEGTQSLMHGQEDLDAAFRFLKSAEMGTKYQLDTTNLIVGGYSYGGHMAMLYATTHDVRRVISISGGDLNIVADQWKKDPSIRKSYLNFFEKLKKPHGPVAFEYEDPTIELFENVEAFSIIKNSANLAETDVLLIGGVDDVVVSLEDHMIPLYRELKKNEHQKVKLSVYNTGHDYNQVRYQLVEEILLWLKGNNK